MTLHEACKNAVAVYPYRFDRSQGVAMSTYEDTDSIILVPRQRAVLGLAGA